MIREKNKQKELLTTLKIKFYRREADIYKSCKNCQIKTLAFFLFFFLINNYIFPRMTSKREGYCKGLLRLNEWIKAN